MRLMCVLMGVWGTVGMAAAADMPATLPQVILPAPELSEYGRLLTNPELNARLSGPGPMTVFVPLDPRRSPDPRPLDWGDDVDEAAAKARGLVVPGAWSDGQLRHHARTHDNRGILTTDTGESLLVLQTPTGRLLLADKDGNTSQVMGPSRPAGNGAVIILDNKLAVD